MDGFDREGVGVGRHDSHAHYSSVPLPRSFDKNLGFRARTIHRTAERPSWTGVSVS